MSSPQVSSSLLLEKNMCGLPNILNTSIISVDAGNISLLEDGDGLLIIDKILVISLDSAAKFFFGRIISAIDMAEVVINGYNIHFVTYESSQQIWVLYKPKFVYSHLHYPVAGM